MTEAKKRAARRSATVAAKRPRTRAATTSHWDISDVDTWGPARHEPGATIPEAGNSALYETGGWRTYVPVIDSEKCSGCMLCYFYCPDASIMVENGKAVGVDLAHCKGCGICARECPTECIEMVLEEKE